MGGIRVNTGAKRIEVNDNGDYIVLNLGDASFADRFFEMADRVQEKTSAAVPRAQKIEDDTEAGSEERIRAASRLFRELYESVMEEIDGFFGNGTCKKVFGDIVPGIELYDDFFTQLMPYFEQAGKERAQRMKKYSAVRTGNV